MGDINGGIVSILTSVIAGMILLWIEHRSGLFSRDLKGRQSDANRTQELGVQREKSQAKLNPQRKWLMLVSLVGCTVWTVAFLRSIHPDNKILDLTILAPLVLPQIPFFMAFLLAVTGDTSTSISSIQRFVINVFSVLGTLFAITLLGHEILVMSWFLKQVAFLCIEYTVSCIMLIIISIRFSNQARIR